jgi:hypothetical protein
MEHLHKCCHPGSHAPKIRWTTKSSQLSMCRCLAHCSKRALSSETTPIKAACSQRHHFILQQFICRHHDCTRGSCSSTSWQHSYPEALHAPPLPQPVCCVPKPLLAVRNLLLCLYNIKGSCHCCSYYPSTARCNHVCTYDARRCGMLLRGTQCSPCWLHDGPKDGCEWHIPQELYTHTHFEICFLFRAITNSSDRSSEVIYMTWITYGLLEAGCVLYCMQGAHRQPNHLFRHTFTRTKHIKPAFHANRLNKQNGHSGVMCTTRVQALSNASFFLIAA